MVDAGIKPDDQCILQFKKLQVGSNFHYIIFKIQDKREIVVEEACDAKKEDWDWDNFVDKIMETGDPRYAAVDFHFENHEGNEKTVLCFVAWVPETAKPGDKMLYASTKEGFKQKLDGVQKAIQATDEEDLDYENVKKIVNK